MENAVYYVASPEACAAILWKSRAAAAQATEALRITAPELVKFQVRGCMCVGRRGGWWNGVEMPT
jgi:acetyl-CoA carboxylase alpha subunit